MRIFLCHSSTDKCFVRSVMALMPERVHAWLDEREMLAGERIQSAIERAIASSAFLIAFVSAASLKSSWVKLELRRALEVEATGDGAFVLPVLIDDVGSKIPDFIQTRRYLRCPDRTKSSITKVTSELLLSIAKWTF